MKINIIQIGRAHEIIKLELSKLVPVYNSDIMP